MHFVRRTMFISRGFSCDKRLTPSRVLGFVVSFGIAWSGHANAAFIGPYSFNNFTLSNVPTCGGDVPDGSALTPDNGKSIVLTGSNSGSGCAATTTLTANAQGAGTVQFSYSYSSLDTPGADFAGYLRNSVFTQLADTNGQSGNVTFPVSSGQSFGFEVATQDSTGEPGVLTVANFSGPLGVTPVPEPGTAILGFTGALAMALAGKKIVANAPKGAKA